ncbi:MAG: NTP transferase domain-containing protein [Armatimonadota bacterium]|nr:NTP transferase domain-containing protein [bacterium]
MKTKFAAVVMAAGKSTRMKSALPKGAHLICGKPMTRHVTDACVGAGIEQVIVVVGYEAEKVKAALGNDISYAYQTQQLGTGHAAMQALPSISGDTTDVIVLPGDAPLITSEAIAQLIETHSSEGNAATILTGMLDDAGHYGRVVRDSSSAVTKIVEAKDADEATLAIGEFNTAIYCFNKHLLAEKLSMLKTDNAQGEYYLTDVIGLLSASGERVGAVIADNVSDTVGINNRIELAEAAATMRKRILDELMLSGVTIVDPATTYIDCDVQIGRDAIVYPCTIIERGSRIGESCEVGPFARLSGVTIGDNNN